MRRKLSYWGHQDIHPENQGASKMWMSLHNLQEIQKINDEISVTRHENLIKHVPIQKRDIKHNQPNSHHPRVPKYRLQ